jgi:hypothetical protein
MIIVSASQVLAHYSEEDFDDLPEGSLPISLRCGHQNLYAIMFATD